MPNFNSLALLLVFLWDIIVLLLLGLVYLPVLFGLGLARWGIIVYDNEVPGRRREAGANVCEGTEDVPNSSTPEPPALEAAPVDVPTASAPTPGASATVDEGATCGHHVLFGRRVASSQSINVEKKAMIEASTQTDASATATSSSSHGLLPKAESAKKSMTEASTQTNEDNIGSSSAPSSPTTLVNTPTGLSSGMGAEDSGHQVEAGSEDVQHEAQDGEGHMQEPDVAQPEEATDVTEDRVAAAPTPMAQEVLLNDEMASHQLTRDELAQLKAQITNKDNQLESYRRRLEEATASTIQLRGANNNLQTSLNGARIRVSELEVTDRELRTQNLSLQGEIQDLTFNVDDGRGRIQQLAGSVEQMSELIREGRNELSFFTQLGASLYSRLNEAEGSLDGALGINDDLIRSIALRLSVHAPVEVYFRDRKVEDNEGPSEGLPTMQNVETVSENEELYGDKELDQEISNFLEGDIAVDSVNVAGVGVQGPILDNGDRQSTEGVSPSTIISEASNGTGLSSTSGEEAQSESPSGVPTSPLNTSLSQNTAVPDVSAVQAAEVEAPNFRNGASAFLFGAQPSSNSTSNGNTGTGSFNFAPMTNFNFGASTPFNAGSRSSTTETAAFEDTDDDEPVEGPAKKSRITSSLGTAVGAHQSSSSSGRVKKEANQKKTASVFEAAAGINLSPASCGTYGETTKTTKTASIFNVVAGANSSSPSSNSKAAFGSSFPHDHQDGSTFPKFPIMNGFNFSGVAARGEEERHLLATETETRSRSGAGSSNTFSFSAGGCMPTFGGLSNVPEGASTAHSDPDSAKQAASAPLCGAEDFAKFNPPASDDKAKSDRFSFGTADACGVQSNTPAPRFNFGKNKQEQEPAAGTPLFTARAFAKSGSPVSNEGADFDQFDSSTAGAFEAQADASSSDFKIEASAGTPEQDQEPDLDVANKKLRNQLQTALHKVQQQDHGKRSSSSPLPGLDVPSTSTLKSSRPMDSSAAKAASSSTATRSGSIDASKRTSCYYDSNEHSDSLYDIEPGFLPPARRPTTVELGPASAINSADAIEGAAMPSRPAQGFFSPLPASTETRNVQTIVTSSNDMVNGVGGSSNADNGDHVEEEAAEALCTSGIPPSTETGRAEVATPHIYIPHGFDVAVLSRIVTSASQAAPEARDGENPMERLVPRGESRPSYAEANEFGGHSWQGRSRTAAEMYESWGMESSERSEPLPTSILWREPEWPAALPPLVSLEQDVAAQLPALPATRAAATTALAAPAPTQEAMEADISSIMGEIAALRLGPATSPATMPNFNREVHLQSADSWAVRPYTIQPQVDGMFGGDERLSEPSVVREEPFQAEIGTSSLPAILAKAPQQDPAKSSQERPAEPKIALETQPKATSRATTSNKIVPQTGLQVNSTATSAASVPVSTAAVNSRSIHGTPLNASGKLRLWSLKKERS